MVDVALGMLLLIGVVVIVNSSRFACS